MLTLYFFNPPCCPPVVSMGAASAGCRLAAAWSRKALWGHLSLAFYWWVRALWVRERLLIVFTTLSRSLCVRGDSKWCMVRKKLLIAFTYHSLWVLLMSGMTQDGAWLGRTVGCLYLSLLWILLVGCWSAPPSSNFSSHLQRRGNMHASRQHLNLQGTGNQKDSTC